MKILSFGDLFLGGRITNENNIEELFSENLKEYIKKADIRIANLESPIMYDEQPQVKNSPWPKKLLQVAPERMVKLLKLLNINYVSLANNHIFDYGEEGLKETIEILEKNSILYSGAGLNIKEALKPAVLKFNNLKIAIYSLCEHNDLFLKMIVPATEDHYGAATINDKNLEKIKICSKNYDINILSLHWGRENLLYPAPYQREFFNKYSTFFPIMLGNHSHVPMRVDVEKNRLIAYSHGNFIFDEFFYNKPSIILNNKKFKEYQITYDLPSPVKKPTLKKWDKIKRISIILEINIDEKSKKIEEVKKNYICFDQEKRKVDYLDKSDVLNLEKVLYKDYDYTTELKTWENENKERLKRQIPLSYNIFGKVIYRTKRFLIKFKIFKFLKRIIKKSSFLKSLGKKNEISTKD